MKISISIDWLQLHCICPSDITAAIYGNYILTDIGRFAAFKNVYEIFTQVNIRGEIKPGERIATLATRPDKGILKPEASFLKIDNKYLYSANLRALVEDIISALNLKFKNISRVDFAADFVCFKNNLHPETFIGRFISMPDKNSIRYVKLRKTKATLYFDHGRINEYSYLRLGTAQSNLLYYLYNKSKELREKKNKPWIKEKWLQDGISDQLQDVWRLEFSIHACSKGLIDNEDKQQLKELEQEKKYLDQNVLGNEELINGNEDEITEALQRIKDSREAIKADAVYFSSLDVIDNYHELYSALFHHYFDFRIEDGQAQKRRMKKIPLLDIHKPAKSIMKLVDSIESNRTDKIILKGLVKLNDELRNKNFAQVPDQNQMKIDDLKKIENFHSNIHAMINHYISSRNLETFAESKFPDHFTKKATIN